MKVQNGKSDGKDTGANLVANLQNVKKHSSYENDVIKTLCASSDEIESENFQGRHPEIFQAQTMEFMASDYLNEAKGGHHFLTVENAVNKVNGSIASALGLPDAPALVGEQAMSR